MEFGVDGFGNFRIGYVLAFLVNDTVFRRFFFEDISVAYRFDVPKAVGDGWKNLVSVILDLFFMCWRG